MNKIKISTCFLFWTIGLSQANAMNGQAESITDIDGSCLLCKVGDALVRRSVSDYLLGSEIQGKQYGLSDEYHNYALVIKFKEGKTVSYCLADKPEITFYAGKLNVVSNYVAMNSYDRSAIENFYFTEMANDIDDVAQDEMRIVYRDNNNVLIYGLPSGDNQINVYDSNARLVSVEVTNMEEYVSVSLSSQSKGVYIIKIGKNQSIKVLKK